MRRAVRRGLLQLGNSRSDAVLLLGRCTKRVPTPPLGLASSILRTRPTDRRSCEKSLIASVSEGDLPELRVVGQVMLRAGLDAPLDCSTGPEQLRIGNF